MASYKIKWKQSAHLMKRLFDLALSIPAFFLLSFLMLIIAVWVRIRIGTPILFRQVRPGLRGQPFTIYKFRTMTDERDKDGNLLPDGERLTRLGRFLRKTCDPQITPVKYASLVLRNLTGQAQIFAD